MIPHPVPMGGPREPAMEQGLPTAPAGATPGAGAQDTAREVLPSAVLLRGGRAVAIEHNGEIYRLQSTRNGKLILTK